MMLLYQNQWRTNGECAHTLLFDRIELTEWWRDFFLFNTEKQRAHMFNWNDILIFIQWRPARSHDRNRETKRNMVTKYSYSCTHIHTHKFRYFRHFIFWMLTYTNACHVRCLKSTRKEIAHTTSDEFKIYNNNNNDKKFGRKTEKKAHSGGFWLDLVKEKVHVIAFLVEKATERRAIVFRAIRFIFWL